MRLKNICKMTKAAEFLIDKMPKAELHLHIEGTLEPEMMLSFAKRNKINLPYETVEDVRKAYEFEDLQSFLDVYYLGMSVLIHKQDFYDLTFAYLTKVHKDGLTHVEMFFDPQAHTERGVSFDTVVDGIVSALHTANKELGISSKLIMCFLRHLSEEEAFETLESACKCKDEIFAVGLDSGEQGNPPKKFSRVFKEAREHGFTAVAHAGEEGPAANVSSSLDDLQVSRIDHGNRAFDDPALIERLVEEKVPLTMCPLSNLRLKGIPSLDKSPVKKALDAGILVSINSDDPSYFGGYLNENYRAVYEALELDENDLIQLAKNSFASSFLNEEDKQVQFDLIDDVASKISS